MRILVIIIAILAFLSGLANVVGGMAGIGAAILMLTTKFPAQVAEVSPMSPTQIGLGLLVTSAVMILNGAMFVIFALGAFMRKHWARILGITAYALNIVVCVLTLTFTTFKGSLTPYLVGTVVAVLFITILALSKNAFDGSLKGKFA